MSYLVPPRLAHVSDEAADVVYLARVPDGAPVVLEGPAALIWLAATGQDRPGHPDDVAGIVARQTGIDVHELRGDVEAFLRTLLDEGLLQEDR